MRNLIATPAAALTIDPGATSYSGMSRTRIFELIKAGELETYRAGRRRLVLRASLDAFIERQRHAR